MTKTHLSTSHDARQIVVRLERRFVRFPDYREGRIQASESTNGQFGCASNTANVRTVSVVTSEQGRT